MSKRRNKTPFQDFERATERSGYETGYIRMVDLQLCCMNELSANAFRLYVMMKSYAKGKVEFNFPHRIFKQFLSKQTFVKARQELIDLGYIKPFVSHANLRTENTYRFSGEWRSRNRDKIDKWVSDRRGRAE